MWRGDDRYRVVYTYGENGERTGKHGTSMSGGSESETLYFSKLWTWRYDGLSGDRLGRNSRHIYLGETRLVTKVSWDDGSFTDEEWEKQYWYHGDHLGSAQAVTNVRGEKYERIEYTPYGEIWIDNASAASNLDIPYRFTGKERDTETGLYYYGARYLDSKTGRWLSTDPALAEYIPEAPVNDAARKRNAGLPGMGGIYNTINAHLYHYAGNNPVKYTDPDGRIIDWVQGEGVSDADFAKAKDMGERIKNSDTEAGKRWRAVETSDKTVTIYVNRDGNNDATPGTDEKETWEDNIRSALLGSDAFVRFDSNNCSLNSGDPTDAEATLAHEVSGHGYRMISGSNPWTRKGRELDASAIENQYRNKITGNDQRGIYDPAKGYQWALPQYRNQNFYIYGTDIRYKLKKTR